MVGFGKTNRRFFRRDIINPRAWLHKDEHMMASVQMVRPELDSWMMTME